MKVLFDQGTPAPLRRLLVGHEIDTVHERGWSTFKNGEMLGAAEASGYQVLVTTDTNLKYQQNLAKRKIAIVALSTTSWPRIQAAAGRVAAEVSVAVPGSYAEVAIP